MKSAGIFTGLLLLGATCAVAQQPTAMAAYDSAGHRLSYPFLGGLDHPRPQLVDIDGDGDLDLFVQEYTGRMIFFENTGRPDSAAFTWRTNQYQGLDVGEWSRFVDVDGDGDADLFAESPFSYIRVFRKAGSKQKARFVTAADTLHDATGTAIFSDRQNIPQIADIDCNGQLDLLLGRASGMVTRYQEVGRDQSGLPQFKFVTDSFQGIQIIGQLNGPPLPGASRGSMHGANTMIVTDLDRDGDPDILWGDYFEAGLLWLVNSGSCAHPVIGRDSVQFPANAPIRTSGYNAPAVADLDGDGDLDAMVGVLGGAYNPDETARSNLYYLEQTAPRQWTERTTQFLSMIDVGSESSPALADLDGDGDLDLVIGNKIDAGSTSGGGLYLYVNRGNPKKAEFHEAGRLPIDDGYHPAPAFGDLDGDGKPDMILGTWRDALFYYRNSSSGNSIRFTLADSAIVRLTRGSYAMPALADLDGDGDLDLIVGESSGELNYYRNEGSRQAPQFVLVSDAMDSIDVGRRSAPALADVDDDGDPDLMVGTDAGPAVLFRNDGTARAPRFVRDSTFNAWLPPLSAPALVDADGNGIAELMTGTSSGGVYYLGPVEPADPKRGK